MRYRFLQAVLAMVVFLSFSAPARAQVETYLLDKPHTQVIFSVNHLGFSNSYGKFLDYDGKIIFDRGTPEKSHVEVTIQTASLDMGDEKWDAHMKNADFFNVEKFPVMTFKSTGIELTGENTADITGDLTILGVTKPVVLATVFKNAGKHPMMDRWGAGFSATATVKRSDFGMSYGVPMVGDEVNIIIEVEAYRDDPAAGGTNNP
jgi:polyisoprenoid-binding protein YceI